MPAPRTDDYFDADMGVVFIQPGGPWPDAPVIPLPCYTLGDTDEPWGDVASYMCKQGDGTYTVVHRSQGLPGEVTFTLETNLPKTRDHLQKAVRRRCPLPVYIPKGHCQGRMDTFSAYEYLEIMADSIVTSRGKTNLIRGNAPTGEGAADVTGMSFAFSAPPMPEEVWKLVISDLTIGEDEILRDVIMSNPVRCGGSCGSNLDLCTYGIIGADADAAAVPDVWETDDGWTTAAAQTDPFGGVVGEHVSCVTYVWKDNETVRYIVGRGLASVVAAPAEIAYNDYNILTDVWSGWTQVALPTANGDFFPHGGCLFALDWRNIWACTDDGLVCKSEDGGITWVSQGAPTPTPAEPLYCIHFADKSYGMCVGGTGGASSVVLTTSDGGAHWALSTAATNPAELLTGVSVIDATHAWIVDAAGGIHYTSNYGYLWTAGVLDPVPTKLGDVRFIDQYCGFVCGYVTVSGPAYHMIVYRTVDGGADWEAYEHTNTPIDGAPTLFGANALHVCDYNHVIVVGEVNAAGDGIAIDLSAKGSV
jgi:photosystem II stability/assembly factor-like uncharacterized protein